jgi:hypothetical protein
VPRRDPRLWGRAESAVTFVCMCAGAGVPTASLRSAEQDHARQIIAVFVCPESERTSEQEREGGRGERERNE